MAGERNGGPTGCRICGDGAQEKLGFDFTMAFQPIVNVETGTIFAHEALVRGLDGAGAGTILAQVTEETRYAFDQAARVRAIELAAGLGMTERLSINFLPNAVYDPATCIQATLAAAERCAFPLDRLVFEITEGEKVLDIRHLDGIVREYKRQGFLTAIDDFGAGWSGLNMLADLQPSLIKIDMALTRGIDGDRVRRSIVGATLQVARDLDIDVIAEGVETEAELDTLRSLGIRLFQGYLFARPAFQRLVAAEDIRFPAGGSR